MNPNLQKIMMGRKTESVNPFLPTDISDIAAWSDFTDKSTITPNTTGAMSALNDKSGASGSNGLSQATVGIQPSTGTRAINLLNAGDFDGTDDRMNYGTGFRTKISGPASYTMFFVMKSDVTTGTRTLISINNGGSSHLVFRQVPTGYSLSLNVGGTLTYVVTPDTNANIIGFQRSGTTTKIIKNGVVFQGTTGGDNTFNNAIGLGYTVQGTTNFWDGLIASVVLYTKFLNNTELNLLGNYYSDEFNIPWTTIT